MRLSYYRAAPAQKGLLPIKQCRAQRGFQQSLFFTFCEQILIVANRHAADPVRYHIQLHNQILSAYSFQTSRINAGIFTFRSFKSSRPIMRRLLSYASGLAVVLNTHPVHVVQSVPLQLQPSFRQSLHILFMAFSPFQILDGFGPLCGATREGVRRGGVMRLLALRLVDLVCNPRPVGRDAPGLMPV